MAKKAMKAPSELKWLITINAARQRNTKPVTSRRIGRGGAEGGALAERVACLERVFLVLFAVFDGLFFVLVVLFFVLLVDLLCAMNRVLSLFKKSS